MQFVQLEIQGSIGWIREVFPGATHDRWSHTVGAFSALISVYNALLADPEVPTLRILLEPGDMESAFVAALIHDVGQTAFGHDFEEASDSLFAHEGIIARLLDEAKWGPDTLRKVIRECFPGMDIDRVLRILQAARLEEQDEPGELTAAPMNPVDGIAADVVNGPIDADKLDYLMCDAVSCGVPYGVAIDARRFAQALTVSVRQDAMGNARLELAYKANGRAAIE